MAFDPTTKHPAYVAFSPSWRLMRDAIAGEDDIHAAGERYLPMKSGQVAIEDLTIRARSYDAYRGRAEFPEIVAPAIRGAVGVMLGKPADVLLPEAMEHLRERATLDGLSLDQLHRRMAFEVMAVGRYGLLPGLTDASEPYLSGYVAESIVNWDGLPADYIVLDETHQEFDREAGEWRQVEQFRQCLIEDGAFIARIWRRTSSGWAAEDEPMARTPRGKPLDGLPFVFVGTNDLTPSPDDVPLYGLARLAVRAYQLDADLRTTLHMTSEPTPWVNGFPNPAQAVEDGSAPTSIGAAKLWLLPEGSTPGFLEFSGAGAKAQADEKADALERAAQFGAQVIQMGQAAESGEALRLRAASQTATLTTIAQVTSAGLERALRNIAVWVGANPDDVVVTPNLEFFDRQLTPDEARAVWEGWLAGVYDWRVAIDRLKAGGWVAEDADPDEIEARLRANDLAE